MFCKVRRLAAISFSLCAVPVESVAQNLDVFLGDRNDPQNQEIFSSMQWQFMVRIRVHPFRVH